MKNIIFITSFLLLISVFACGQKIGLSAGYNYSTIKHSSDVYAHVDELNEQVKPKSGFNIGVNYEIPLSKVFYIEPRLVFTSRGCNNERPVDDIGEPYVLKSSTTLYYLDLPILFKSKVDLGKVTLFAGFGPYFSYGLFEVYKVNGQSYTKDFSDSNRRKFDCGLLFSAGVEYGNFQIGASYQLGLANLKKESMISSRNRVASLSVGYRFSKKSK